MFAYRAWHREPASATKSTDLKSFGPRSTSCASLSFVLSAAKVDFPPLGVDPVHAASCTPVRKAAGTGHTPRVAPLAGAEKPQRYILPKFSSGGGRGCLTQKSGKSL